VAGAVSIGIALGTVIIVLLLALKHGGIFSRVVAHRSDEIVLLTTFGLVLLIAGIAQRLQVSAAVGAFLVGLALSGTVADQARTLFEPLRDLFAAIFFLFVGLQIVPASVPSVLWLALILAFVTTLTKIATGWIAAGWDGVAIRGRMRAGTALVARGEFSVVIAGLGTAIEPRLAPLAAAYVLLMAIVGPILARFAEPMATFMQNRQRVTESELVAETQTASVS
jgi:CPA2 family monovalent cation:H+ antiporter-2